jgi:hypothetical protein
MRLNAALALIVMAATTLLAQTGHAVVNSDVAVMQDFQKRVDAYLQLRKGVEAQMPKLKATPSQEKIQHHEAELGRAVRESRKNAKQGDVFSLEITAEIRRLTTMAIQPGDGAHIGQSLRHAEPVHIRLNVNDRYPHHIPLQSTPPSLLENLPKLPPDIEYRVTGADLVLLDTKANLIIDLIPGMFS